MRGIERRRRARGRRDVSRGFLDAGAGDAGTVCLFSVNLIHDLLDRDSLADSLTTRVRYHLPPPLACSRDEDEDEPPVQCIIRGARGSRRFDL